MNDDEAMLDRGTDALIRAASASPPEPEAVLDLSWVLQYKGLASMALLYAKQATDLMPDIRDSWAFRARAHLALKQRSEAETCLECAIRLPDHVARDVELLERLRSGEEELHLGAMCFSDVALTMQSPAHEEEKVRLLLFELRQLLKQSPEDTNLLYHCALLRRRLCQYAEAEDLLNQLLRLDSSHADGHVLLGLVCQKTDRPEAALAHYLAAVDSNPLHVMGNTNAAFFLVTGGRVLEGRRHLEVALAQDPEYAPALTLYGNTIALVEKDYKAEIEYHRRAVQNDPNEVKAQGCLCMALLQAGEYSQAKRAFASYKSSLLSDPEAAGFAQIIKILIRPPKDVYQCFGLLKERPGATLLAGMRPLLDTAWALRKDIPQAERAQAMTTLGIVAGHSEQHDISVEAFREAEQLEGRGGAATLSLAEALFQAEHREEALALVMEVSPEVSRSLTVRANILMRLGRLTEALDAYISGIGVDASFPLPVVNGMELCIRLREWARLSQLVVVARERFPGFIEPAAAVAQAFLALGKPLEAADAVLPFIFPDGIQLDSPLVDPSKARDLDYRDDDTVRNIGRSDDYHYVLAKGLLRSRRLEELDRLLSWAAQAFSGNGDWDVLAAERFRLQGRLVESQTALQHVREGEAPRLVSEALCAYSQGDFSLVENLAHKVVADPRASTQKHPQGSPVAVAHALQALIELSRDRRIEAESSARAAVASDPTCPLAFEALARVLDAQMRPTESLAALNSGLQNMPGEPSIVEALVMRCLDGGDFDGADDVLDRCEDNFRSYGQPEKFHLLRALSARGRLQDVLVSQNRAGSGSSRDILSQVGPLPAWFSTLAPQSQRWLECAMTARKAVSSLRLGIALYLCKVAELELVERLVVPFANLARLKQVSPDPTRDPLRLRDLSQFIETGRAPSLGGIRSAIEVATIPPSPSDSVLLLEWRAFLHGLTDRVLQRQFISNLWRLANMRNRVAHLGDLTEEQLSEVAGLILLDDQPGPLLAALGVSA